MNKNHYFIIVWVLICILHSCNKQEIFNPSRYILAESKLENSGSKIIKQFNYSDKELISVDLVQEKINLKFEYNKDKTVKKITSSDASYALFEYDKKHITQIQYYEGGKLTHENKFYRKEKKNTINKIETYTYDGFSSEGILLKMLFPESKSVPEAFRKMHKSTDGSLYAVRNVTYEGDNIQRVRLYYIANNERVEYSTTTYSYDDKKNPYYGLPYAFLDLTGYNKNNAVTEIISYENHAQNILLFTIRKEYAYEHKYPTTCSITERTTTTSNNDSTKYSLNYLYK